MKNKLIYNPTYDHLSDVEIKILAELGDAIQSYVRKTPQVNNINYKTRDVHATTYGALKGKILFDNQIINEGLFPQEELDVLLRISNSHLKLVNGFHLPAFGLALKILKGNETWANYPLVNFPLFPFTNVKHFLKVFIHINGLYSQKGLKKLNQLLGLNYHLIASLPAMMYNDLFKHGFILFKNRNKFIMHFDYHSIGVYRWGNHLIKIKLKPISEVGVYSSIEEFMKVNKAYHADLYIQFAYNEKKQPINRLNKEWTNSPFIKVGKIICDELLDPLSADVEALSFNPFESKENLRPVGRIQKLRDYAYQSSLKARQS